MATTKASRLWLAMLYVVLESWRSTHMAPVRELTDRVVGSYELERVRGRKNTSQLNRAEPLISARMTWVSRISERCGERWRPPVSGVRGVTREPGVGTSTSASK